MAKPTAYWNLPQAAAGDDKSEGRKLYPASTPEKGKQSRRGLGKKDKTAECGQPAKRER